MNVKPSTIFTGDNLPVMRGMNSESVDLIYLDPPFNSNANYAAPIGSEAAGAEFKDTWTLSDIDKAWHGELADVNQGLHDFLFSVSKVHSKSMFSYLIYMAIRLLEMHRILKPTGSIYLHCDPTASHYLKTLMDAIFGRKNFQNEIVWKYNRWTAASRRLQKMHDTIFWYSKGDTWTYNRLYKDYSDSSKQAHDTRGFIQRGSFESHPNKKGVSEDDVWLLNFPSRSKERTGYPTQKPLSLLERIVTASSNEGDIVLDPFCGCATACIAAEKLERNWVGIDISPKAAELVKIRAEKELTDLFVRGRIFQTVHREDIPKRTDIAKIPKYNIKENKNFLYGEQQGVCTGCTIHFPYRNLTIDHKTPQAKGGNDHIDNLQLLCGACNSTKGKGTHAELLAKLANRK